MIVMHCVLNLMIVRPVKPSQKRKYIQPSMHRQRGLLETIYKGNGVAVRNGMLVI